MKRALAMFVALAVSAGLVPVAAQSREEARPRDLRRLQDDLANLDEALRALETGDPKADSFRGRAEEIREETIYLKVKMRHQQRAGRDGTGVLYDEVVELGRAIADLREEMERAFSRGSRELQIPQGAEIAVRLDEPLSSRSARREDRFEASVFRPVRAEGFLAIPAGARVRGVVRDCEPAQRPSRGGRLELDFDALYLDRSRLDLRGRVVSIHDEDQEDDKAGKAGIGAVLGGVLGGILGGKRGAVVGILAGGTGAVVGTKGDDVDLPAGAILRVRLEKPLMVPR